MLGKTNLTKVEKGAIINDVADYSWNASSVSGITGNFVKTLYAGNILIGITIDGTVAYTKDGENWEIKKIELDSGDSIELADITYGNGKYVIVGNHCDSENLIHGLIVTTEDFATFEIVSNWHSSTAYPHNNLVLHEKIVAVTEINNTFIMCTFRAENSGPSSSTFQYISTYMVVINDIGEGIVSGDMSQLIKIDLKTASYIKPLPAMNSCFLKSAKKIDGTLICYIHCAIQHNCAHDVIISKDGRAFETLIDKGSSLRNPSISNPSADLFNPCECKDNLYFMANTTVLNYRLSKVVGNAEALTLSENIEYGFLDAAYFNKCEIFVNNHQMLVIHPGESIADKAIDDLVDITYDFSISSIMKAFDKLYIFGTDGNILVSSNESNNEESLAIKAMSATKALYDAKAYTDEKIEALKKEMQEIGDEEIQAIWNEVFGESNGT